MTRDRQIIIERLNAHVDSRGHPTKDAGWGRYAAEWAAVYFGTGSEQRAAAQVQSVQAASFEVLSNDKTRGILTSDRIVFDGGYWNIRSVAPIGRNQGVKINAVKSEA